jgi:hypothetical protein
MADPDPADDWLIIESYARWAGDVIRAADALSKAEVRRAEDTDAGLQRRRDQIPMAVIEWAAVRQQRREETSNRESLYLQRIAEPETIDEQPIDRRPTSPFFESENMRAVVSMITEREFELRAYPNNLDAVDGILQRARGAQQKFASAGRVEAGPTNAGQRATVVRATGASWVMPGRLLRSVWVDAFGLVFVRGIWTPPEPIEQMGEVYNQFREVLRVLD